MKIFSGGVIAALALPAMAGAAHADGCGNVPVQQIEMDRTVPITLRTAIVRAGQTSPEVLAATLEARAASADADQAGRWLNPTLSIETENFAGSGAVEAFDGLETTASLSQTFRLGDKRRLAERAGRARAALASAQCNVQRLETQTLAGELFLELRAATEISIVARQSADLAGEFASVVQRRVDAGASAPPELARARAEEATLLALAEAASGEVEADALALASVWGSPAVDFGLPVREASTGVESGTPVPEETNRHPRLAAAEASVTALEAETRLSRAGALPDVTVSAGIRRFEETGDNAFLAGVSLPLPLFDRNRDATRAAGLRSEGAQVSARAVAARLRTEQASLAARARAARARLERLENKALPFAEEAYSAAAKGYEYGKFNLTATLDARRSLIQTRAAVIDARLTVETETLRLRALIGAAPFESEIQ